jgi:hypothetical protein
MDHFNRGVAPVLAELYQAFPEKRMLCPARLDPNVSDPVVHQLFARTIEFLLLEGFIRSGGPADGFVIVPNATLTIKGLEILNSVPDSIKDRTTLGEKVTAAAKVGGKEVIGAVVGQVIGAAARAFIQPSP